MSSQPAPATPTRLLGLVALAGLLMASAWVLFTATRELRAEWTMAPARFSAQRWAEGQSQPANRAQWESVLLELRSAESIRGSSPILQETLGNTLVVGATLEGVTADERSRLLKQAQQHFKRSVDLRPTDGMTWALLADAFARDGQYGDEMLAAAEKALKLGPNEGHVQQMMMQTVMLHWDHMPARMLDWASGQFENGTLEQRQAINRIGANFGIELQSDKPPKEAVSRKARGAS